MNKIIILFMIGLLILGTTGCANDDSEEKQETKTLSEQVNIESDEVMRINHGLNTDCTAKVKIFNEDNNDWAEWEKFKINENVLEIENTKDTNRKFEYVIEY